MEELGKSRLLKKKISRIALMLLLTSIATLTFNIQPVKASGTIYIRADGSIDPPTAPITSSDNVTYTFTDNIYDEIVVERDNIMVDGAGYTLQGIGNGRGIDLSGRSNVTIKNTNIKNFYFGIHLSSSSNNSIIGNDIPANKGSGIELSLARASYSRNRNRSSFVGRTDESETRNCVMPEPEGPSSIPFVSIQLQILCILGVSRGF